MRHGLDATARQLVFVLPLLMGSIEYILRVGFDQPGKDEFFPISLIVAGIGLFVALTILPEAPKQSESRESEVEQVERKEREERYRQQALVAKTGVWFAVGGVAAWIYLLAASFSEKVRAIIPFYPLMGASVYYLLGAVLTEWKARLPK
jgi:hypothetical protein